MLHPGLAADRQADYYFLVVDIWGDSREEVIMFGSRATRQAAQSNHCSVAEPRDVVGL
jgi:hypothetical protein